MGIVFFHSLCVPPTSGTTRLQQERRLPTTQLLWVVVLVYRRTLESDKVFLGGLICQNFYINVPQYHSEFFRLDNNRFPTFGSFLFWLTPQCFMILARIHNNIPHSFSILNNAFQKNSKPSAPSGCTHFWTLQCCIRWNFRAHWHHLT